MKSRIPTTPAADDHDDHDHDHHDEPQQHPAADDDGAASEPEESKPTTRTSRPRSRRTNKLHSRPPKNPGKYAAPTPDAPCKHRNPASTIAIRSDKGKPRAKYNSRKRTSRKEEAEIIQLASKGLSIPQIVKTVDKDRTTIHKIIKEHKNLLQALDNIDEYRRGRRDLLTAAEMIALKSLADESVIQAATLNQRAFAFSKIFEARRLESGQSTSNTQTFTTVRLEHIPSGRGEEVEISTAPQPEKKE